MIGTFWNLCRACPSMPVDKLHSEYRSTYRWHEYTGPRQEVVRKPPQPLTGNKEEEENKNVENVIAPPTSGGGIEPALPRRKKNPSLAYRSHDLLTRSTTRDKDSTSLDRARCADRDRERSGRRSKSEGPPHPPSPLAGPRVLRSDSDPSQFAQDLMSTLPLEGGGLKNAISRISTEYRLQFAWPRGKRGTEEESTGPPRKSLSMGAIKPAAGSNPTQNLPQQPNQQAHNQPAPVHKKRIPQADKFAGTAELEPLVSNQEDYAGEEKIVQESFSKGEKLQLSDNAEFKTEYKKKFRPFSQYDYIEGRFKPKKDQEPQIVHEMENEHGDSWFSEVIELRKKAGEYKHRGWGTELVPEHIAELYNKQITLWEQVSRRSSLSALSLASSTHRSITKEEKEKENNKKSSPTKALWPDHLVKSNQKNEKLDDVKKDIPPRSRIDHFIRHHLERTTGGGEEGILHSPTREKLEPVIIRKKEPGTETTRSPQKVQTYTGRSQSAGPNTGNIENRSPKRTPRVIHGAKPTATEKRQRPTTLDTAPSRTKQKTGSNKAANLKNKSAGTRTKQNQKSSQSINKEKAADEVESSEAEILEPVVKSPPEPTRVKSPEQVLMRSPEPVNWTVPLDTGKTFTVTQNVTEGEGLCRPHSESKMRSESVEAPPPPPQSAPPALTDDTEWKKEEEVKKNNDKPVPGSTLRCLEDPSFTFDTNSHEQKPSSDVLEKAHSRFDQFWGKTSQENLDNQGQA